ncbi:conserved hypothetical protein [Leishmania infantum JPCM5]|uniref:Uncharacterized protein n=2 Tax=Leishmania infantum TaxID=5671 RepID=A4HSK4_LEIIN|nr:conserved hypothetical protein [Leishmania infantum JPCM5]CAC9443895.1 hypothetical_protein_-_conserved [Leishmania infantum]CAM65392.1 conserved hypothetical protein [Leishmania infantum JPCM5]SUZ39003.1 hypothetical_protein_-_conserved [Leishmania infantum]|eukprot:XP_001463045.1 conserved hypothetical protein [Leishmania infantum JPCM5]
MGKSNPRRRNKASAKNRPKGHQDCTEVEKDVAGHVVLAPAQPPHTFTPLCVQQLRESREYAVLEDACSDIAYFALQLRHNNDFLREAVPQRLAQLLIFSPPYEPPQLNTNADATPVVASPTLSAAATAGEEEPQPHKGILHMQIAAAEALRTLVVNSEQDRVIDALTSAGADAASGDRFAEGLARLVQAGWQRVQQARRRMAPEDWMGVNGEEGEEDAGSGGGDEAAAEGEAEPAADASARHHRRRQSGFTRNLYFILLRHLEEVLALASVCVEASEVCAQTFSSTSALLLLLDVLRVAITTTWETLLHPSADYYADEAQVPVASETALAIRAFKRREAGLLASLAVSTADLLLLLSPENQSLAQVFTGSSEGNGAAVAASSSSFPSAAGSSPAMTAEQTAFLNTVVDAVDLRAWLAEKPAVEVQLQERFSDASLPSFLGAQHTAVAMERERVLHDLLRATLSIQGVLLHIAPVAANLQRVLPLLDDTLHKASLPMHVWCGVLPLLMGTCERADDDVRAAAATLTTHRLRSTQAAVRLLHVMVNAVGEKNDTDRYEDDEAAFAANPLAKILQSGELLYAFGLLLKDVLWMSPNSDSSGNAATVEGPAHPTATRDVMAWQAQQRALRAEASSNAAATEMQMVLLATEVNVWEVASTLLLMLPVASLGDPAPTWRALLQAVLSRYQLHLDAAAMEASEGEGRSAHANILQHSARTHQLLWMQLESLGQMLWTMQRKQSKASGGSAAVTACNHVQATSEDVDLLIRVSWEASASTLLRQSCVGAVGLLCASMQREEAVATAARFALAVVANGGPAATSYGKKLLDVYAQLVPGKTPTYPAERRVWLQQLALADAAATVRCEAANTLIDLFLDERHDAAVYWPLGVQEKLSDFKRQLAIYVKRRQQLDKETKRLYHVSTETPDAEQWSEVLENLSGFIDYKAHHK